MEKARPMQKDAGTQDDSQVVTRAGTRPSVAGTEEMFTGTVRMDPLFDPVEAAPYAVGNVTFEPGARTRWHTHPAGQRLVVVAGCGRAGTWGREPEAIRPGDVVWFPPHVKHWHGAAPTTAMTHMAFTGMKDGSNVTWMEEVDDSRYDPHQ